ncbi:nucleotidyl transferase AbiEii/AbiGii toxin family protein [Fulvivirga sp. M361]|uniref:nucleotidyl transferase AbiEii/AbiGii toxin family protein n=1 Tax=Fulvivirga sp. M361 TaxID=2594266 RepID=UPI00117A18F9|nr:nucleotidyl transferase AbiEii/AbiGii toxin family protein [Fulvivirga sp. M361]TRX54314.1 nucleotidyl transferase AbiEii/AbiGii toxin family protein [Fulvivirga sp. M361]
MNEIYKGQVSLLLSVIPEIAKEKCFALHGGTAINLFVREMPRLSVDIDLTYVPIEDRHTSLDKIAQALEGIRERILSILPKAKVQHQREVSKLQISNQGYQIKVEVNQTNRGILSDPIDYLLCETAQDQFDAFCSIAIVPLSQLYGGKICAALDRQHPRDIFDVKYLLENEGFTEDIKEGLLLSILSSNRPIHELLRPNLLDQQAILENQFSGMTTESFAYKDFEATREQLIANISKFWTDSDRQFLIGFSKLEPDWSIYDFERFPSVHWKIQNLAKLRQDNPDKHREQVKLLKEVLVKE